jgi:hypothetical protein
MTIWDILRPFGLMKDCLVEFVVIGYILSRFWYVWADKNLATLPSIGFRFFRASTRSVPSA